MLQSTRLEDNMKTIGIEQSLCNRSYFENKFLNNIRYIYQHAGKCDNQQNLTNILDAVTVSTPEGVIDEGPHVPMTSTLVKKPSARKSLCLFINILNVKNKTAKRRIGAEKYKCRSIKLVNSLCTKKNRTGHSKINEQIKRNMYAWITRHHQVVQSPISNDCLKVMFDDQKEPQLVPNFLLQVAVRELHNSLVRDPNYGGHKDARDEDDNIIISDYILRSLLPPK